MNHLATNEPAMRVRQIGQSFGAEVTGMSLHSDVNPDRIAAIVALLHRYRVLVIPDADLTPAELVAFSRRFGPLEIHSRFDNTLPEHREVFCVGNVGNASFSRGVEQWHADSSYRSLPSDASLFYGEIVPQEGADTMFADATAAYRSLDAAMKQRIDSLVAVHSLETLRVWGQRQNPDRQPGVDDQSAEFPPVSQPLVRLHPVTGARSLYLCPAVISHIEGMDEAEGASLIETLIAHVTQPRYVYTHHWQQGDLVVWDNRAVLHTASLFDHTRFQRLMYRTTVAGNAPGLAA